MNRARYWAGMFCLIFILGGCRSINRNVSQTSLRDRTVIFSFDDGPNDHEDTTARLLEVLEKHQIRALFVLLGENSLHNPALVQQIYEKGHIIASHGYSGKWAVWMNSKKTTGNLIQWEETVNNALGEIPQPRLYRPHGGFYNRKQEKLWSSLGYTLLPVTARAYDAVRTKSRQDEVVSAIVSAVEKQGGGIILLHDARDSHTLMEKELAKAPEGPFNRSWIPGAVEEIILSLEAKGYRVRGFDILKVLGLEE